MLRSVASKIAWAGRTASMMFGLALIMAVVLGVGTMALAAAPGDPFKLGRSNSINKISTLVGSVAGPLLKVDNNGGGPALRLESKAGKAPLTVNSAAGTAKNLSADKLDGKDSGAFLNKSGKAADSDRLDSKDSTAFMPSATYHKGIVTFGQNLPSDFNSATLACNAGDRLLGGGVRLVDQGTHIAGSTPRFLSQTWEVFWVNNATPDQIGISILCADR